MPLLSFQHSDGIGITDNNAISDLNIDASANHKAIYNTIVKQDLGTFTLKNLFIKGQVSVITRSGVDKASIVIDNVDIVSADARHYLEQPQIWRECIARSVADYITAGVFVLYGTNAKEVITDGEVITYGINDMVLDVWGSVDNWTSNAAVISYGPSGVGFVNFGIVKNFTVNAALQT